MIDKELSDLKKDFPDYNIDDYKNGIYKKYNKLKTVNSSKRLSPLKYVLSPLLIILIVSLTIIFVINNGDAKVNAYEADRELLTRVVYNASVKDNETYEISNISRNKKFSNNLYYTSLKIHESFGFTATFDFIMEPYFNDYIIGEEVFIVITLLEFSSDEFANNSFLQKMIIFSYKNEVVGFMSPRTTSSLYGDFNEASDYSDETVKTLHTFDSAMFLTKDAVVKYYEKGDILYSFEFLEYENGNINLFVESNQGECNSTIINDSIVELSENVIIELLELTYIEKIEIVVTIIGFDEKNSKKIFVKSEEIPSIESVYYRYAILDLEGNVIEIDELNIGDSIKIYYFQRYKSYQPKNLTIDNIIVDR